MFILAEDIANERTEDASFEKSSSSGNEGNNDESDHDENPLFDVGSSECLGPFDTMDEAEKELQGFADKCHFRIRTMRSNIEKRTSIKKNAAYAYFFSGKSLLKRYAPASDKKIHRNTESKRNDCPFQVYIGRRKDVKFYITMKNSNHNHQPSEEEIVMDPSKRQLNEDQVKLIATLYKSGARPASIRATLTEKYDRQVIDQRSIYNTVAKARLEELDGNTPIQFLVSKLFNGNSYAHETIINANNGKLECLFFYRRDMLLLSIASTRH